MPPQYKTPLMIRSRTEGVAKKKLSNLQIKSIKIKFMETSKKQSFPTITFNTLADIKTQLNNLNLGGESSTPISEDFEGTISGDLELTKYSGMTGKQPDGSINNDAMRHYEIGALSIVGDVVDTNGNKLENRKARLSKKQFEALINVSENSKVTDIPVKAEKWSQKRFNTDSGLYEDVDRYRLVVSTVKAETAEMPVNTAEAAITE